MKGSSCSNLTIPRTGDRVRALTQSHSCRRFWLPLWLPSGRVTTRPPLGTRACPTRRCGCGGPLAGGRLAPCATALRRGLLLVVAVVLATTGDDGLGCGLLAAVPLLDSGDRDVGASSDQLPPVVLDIACLLDRGCRVRDLAVLTGLD